MKAYELQDKPGLDSLTRTESSSDEKLAIARQLGADEAINYKAQGDWGQGGRSAHRRAIAQHGLRPWIGKSFGLEEARAAYEYLSSGARTSNVTISI